MSIPKMTSSTRLLRNHPSVHEAAPVADSMKHVSKGVTVAVYTRAREVSVSHAPSQRCLSGRTTHRLALSRSSSVRRSRSDSARMVSAAAPWRLSKRCLRNTASLLESAPINRRVARRVSDGEDGEASDEPGERASDGPGEREGAGGA